MAQHDGPEGSSVYTLQSYVAGEVAESYLTNSLRDAQAEYTAAYLRNGVTPRLLIDGERVPIWQADILMGHKLDRNPRKNRKG